MGVAEAFIILVIAAGAVVIPLCVVYYATRAPDRAWQVFARKTGMNVVSNWGKFTITGRLRRIQIDIRARRQPGFFQMNATMDGTATLPGPVPEDDPRVRSALAAIGNITADYEIAAGELRWKMTSTPAQISRVPILLEQIARVADVVGEAPDGQAQAAQP